MAQHEYTVGLATASTSEELVFVANAFRAGELKERTRIADAIEAAAEGSDHLNMALFKLRKIINNDQTT